MGHNNSIDSIDLSNGEFLYSIGKVQLSIGLLHFISETQKNSAVVEWPHKLLSIRSICQMENSDIRLEKSSFPLECCISLARLREIFVDSIDSIDLSNGKFLYSIGKVQLSIGLLHLISDIVVVGPVTFCRFDRLVKWKILIFDRKSPASIGQLHLVSEAQKNIAVVVGPVTFGRFDRFVKWRILIFDRKSPAFHWTVASRQRGIEKYRRSSGAP